jgi:hypothetical protein
MKQVRTEHILLIGKGYVDSFDEDHWPPEWIAIDLDAEKACNWSKKDAAQLATKFGCEVKTRKTTIEI